MKNHYPNLYRMLPKKAAVLVDRWKDFSPATIAIMFKTAFALLCLALCTELTFAVLDNSSVQNLDVSILQWVETLRTPVLNKMMIDITALGGLALTIVIGLLIISIFLLIGDPAAAIHLFLTSAGGFYISTWTKALIMRPRPLVIPQLVQAGGSSYPSGHAITTAALFLTMALLAFRHIKSFRSRVILLIITALMIALISFSRIYLGVHYPSDTLSGAFIGMAWALIMAALFAKTHYRKRL